MMILGRDWGSVKDLDILTSKIRHVYFPSVVPGHDVMIPYSYCSCVNHNLPQGWLQTSPLIIL